MAEVGIFVGTVYGNALLVAEEAEALLTQQGHHVTIFEDPEIADWARYQGHYSLVITSTTGNGDLPDNIRSLYHAIKDAGYFPHHRYGLIALGDSGYEHFCGGGKQFDALLKDVAAQRVGDMLLVDAAEDPEPEQVTNAWVEHWGHLI